MPWRELTVIDQREEFAKLALVPGVNLSELCRRFGISRSNGHKWLGRYLKQGPTFFALISAMVRTKTIRRATTSYARWNAILVVPSRFWPICKVQSCESGSLPREK